MASVAVTHAARVAAQVPRSDGKQTGHALRIGISLAHVQARDELLAPLRWQGPGLALEVGWDVDGARDDHRLTFMVPFALLENRFGHRGFLLGAGLEYAYRRSTPWSMGGGPLHLGGRMRYLLHDGFYESWDQEHGYWLTAYTLAPAASWSGAPGSRLEPLSLSVTLPLLAAVSRPERNRVNKIDDLTRLGFHLFGTQRDLELATLPRYLAPRATLAWRRVGGSGLDLSYDLEYATYASPERVSALWNRITFGHRF
jgi:hypothetical protein